MYEQDKGGDPARPAFYPTLSLPLATHRATGPPVGGCYDGALNPKEKKKNRKKQKVFCPFPKMGEKVLVPL